MAQDLKTRVHDFWQANPCGAKFTDAEIGSREFFDAVERHRRERFLFVAFALISVYFSPAALKRKS